MGQDITNRLTQLYQSLRHDSDALFELRQLVFGVIIALALVYGLYLLQVESREKERRKLRSYRAELVGVVGEGELASLLANQLQQLGGEKEQLTSRIGRLHFQEKILREQFDWDGGGESFANVIFTLLPLSPVDIENGFVQMKVMETRSHDYYDINPIRLQGDMEYSEFVYYLRYLEQRSEVGMIDKVHLELVPEELPGQQAKVHFDVVLGRIHLHPKKEG